MNVRTAVISIAISLVPLAACQSSGGTANDPGRAMARLSDASRADADNYISAVSDLSRQLIAVTDTASARAAMPSIESAVSRISQSAAQLTVATPEAKADISTAFGRRISNVNESYAAQVDRIKGTPGIGSVLGPLLDKVRMYR
jgi:hypothetical protein